jgi:hypothetical protein
MSAASGPGAWRHGISSAAGNRDFSLDATTQALSPGGAAVVSQGRKPLDQACPLAI